MSKFLKTYSYLLVVFLYMPILVLLIYSVNENPYSNKFTGLTLNWYEKVIDSPRLVSSLKNSFFVALVSSLASVLLGLTISYAIHRIKGKIISLLRLSTNILLVVPDIAMAIGMSYMFQLIQFSNGITAIIFSHITFGLAYATIIISIRLSQMNNNLENASRDLGATEWQTLKLIILPYIYPGIISAFFVCFILSWDDFIYAFFNSSPGDRTLPVEIFSTIKKGISPQINAIAVISMLVSFVVIYIGFKSYRLLIFQEKEP